MVYYWTDRADNLSILTLQLLLFLSRACTDAACRVSLRISQSLITAFQYGLKIKKGTIFAPFF
jgi:hypothetical protein